MTASAPVASRRFELADQLRFARLSGDVNPMHVDAIAARRLLTGRPVVHGVHTLLTALEHGALPWPAAWRLDADFLNPLSVGDELRIRSERDDADAPLLLAEAAGLAVCRVAVTAEAPPRPPVPACDEVEPIALGAQPLDREPASWVGRCQRLALPAARFDAEFPRCCAQLGERRVAAIALLSSYVGMVCPGLHSVFSSLSVEPGDPQADALRFRVRRYDPRFRIFVIDFDGPVRGEIKAFLRATAQAQPDMAALQPLLRPGEFAPSRHWVIGGSRGLGELVAKLLAAGGAGVTLSYASGADDAQRVVADIAAAGAPAAEARHLDLTQPDFGGWLDHAPWPDAVWYFATPRIFRKKAGLFDAALLDEFLGFYVRRFEALCQALEQAAGARRSLIFYPSTAFIGERPKGMTEYAMAKAAAEVLIDDLARTLRQVKPVARRLPRLATDQTAGLAGGSAMANAEVMLPVLRELLAAS
ncbi:MAG: MaoC/PaaZ C-terminal domain-containing protein [Rubrivivax sp.]